MRRPLLISYGGGHANIMIALARELTRRGTAFDLIGLTTAFAAFERAGLAALDVTALVDPAADAGAFAAMERYLLNDSHPDISRAQTHAYFALGFADLARRLGEDAAHRLIAVQGRKAFEPISIFARHFSRQPPSVLVATTAPRFELAAIRAARAGGIATLAVGDHFLHGESAAITSGDHADHLVVLAQAVADRLRAAGRALPRLHALGNPAFDTLAPRATDGARREELRARLGLAGKFVLFWPLGGGAQSGSGERLLAPEQVIALLEPIMHEARGSRYLLRAHPNWPVSLANPPRGLLCPPGLSAEDCLLVSDLVIAESTTLGLQALLRGIPVIAFGHADLTLYPHYGWASLAHAPQELRGLILGGNYLRPPAELARLVGNASSRTADLIEQLHGDAVGADMVLAQ